MSEILTYDATPTAEVMSSIESDEAESLAIGEELMAAHDNLLAGKYKNAQELEEAYINLQKKLGKQGSDEEVTDDEEYSEEELQDEDVDEDESEDYAVDFLAEVNQEFFENGEISEESMEKFSQMSSRELVEAYLRFQDKIGGFQEQQQTQGVELTENQVNQIKNAVGGDAAYSQLTSWASENLSQPEIEAFDQLIDSGNMPAINFALQALYLRYTDAMGYEGETLQGKPARSAEVFRSQAELVQAMADPRYDRDPAYRQDVIAKLERSDIDF